MGKMETCKQGLILHNLQAGRGRGGGVSGDRMPIGVPDSWRCSKESPFSDCKSLLVNLVPQGVFPGCYICIMFLASRQKQQCLKKGNCFVQIGVGSHSHAQSCVGCTQSDTTVKYELPASKAMCMQQLKNAYDATYIECSILF